MSDNGNPSLEAEIYRRLADMTAEGEPGVVATVIAAEGSTPRHAGSRMIILPDGLTVGSVGGGLAEATVIEAADDVLAGGECKRIHLDLAGGVGVCGGKMEVFLEPVLQTDPFWIIGAGHVGRAVVEVGRSLPFRFVLVDDRPEVLATLPAGLPAKILERVPAALADDLVVPPRGGVLLASRSVELDGEYLATILAAEEVAGREFTFLGGIASRRKAGVLRRSLEEKGADPARLARMQLPVGLAVGAETPAEIALSILAEALAVLRGAPVVADEDGRSLGVYLQRRRDRS